MTIREMFEAARRWHTSRDPDVDAGRVTRAMLDRRAPGFYVVDLASGLVVSGPHADQLAAVDLATRLHSRGGRETVISQVVDVPT